MFFNATRTIHCKLQVHQLVGDGTAGQGPNKLPPAVLRLAPHFPLPEGLNTVALKDGTMPEQAAHSAKRCFLNRLETSSFRPESNPQNPHSAGLPALPASTFRASSCTWLSWHAIIYIHLRFAWQAWRLWDWDLPGDALVPP